jgi:lipoyl(octanoyl) transferase
VFEVLDFGLSPFETMWAEQHRLVEARLAKQIPNTVLLGEHLPVYTRGRRSQKTPPPTHLPHPVVDIERGGEVTWHGPGQLMVYAICYLPKPDLHAHVRWLEQLGIDALTGFGLEAQRMPGLTGVWIETDDGPRKVGSIGVAVKRWVTYHGLALNVTNDLTPFAAIDPCGLSAQVMTRAADHAPALTVSALADAIKSGLRG